MFGISSAQIHLAVNHLPVVGILLASATLVLGATTRRDSVRHAGLALAVFAAVATAPAYFSGDGAEEIVEDRPGVSERLIENHEEAAEGAAVINVLAGLAAAAAYAATRLGRHRTARNLFVATLAISLVATALMARVAHLGGQIRHDELRAPAVSAAAPVPGRGDAHGRPAALQFSNQSADSLPHA